MSFYLFATNPETSVGGMQGHAPCNFCSKIFYFCVSRPSKILWDCHKVKVYLATLQFLRMSPDLKQWCLSVFCMPKVPASVFRGTCVGTLATSRMCVRDAAWLSPLCAASPDIFECIQVGALSVCAVPSLSGCRYAPCLGVDALSVLVSMPSLYGCQCPFEYALSVWVSVPL